jgi:hypothetical protein
MKLVCICFVMFDVWVLVLCLGVSCSSGWLMTVFRVNVGGLGVFVSVCGPTFLFCRGGWLHQKI